MRLSAALDLVLDGDMARELAIAQKVCVRPLIRRVEDRQTCAHELVAIPCGKTRETVCPSCAHKSKVVWMHRCAEGWHRDSEPDPASDELEPGGDPAEEDQVDEGQADDQLELDDADGSRRVRSTRRRQDAPDLPRVDQEDRTVGRSYTTPDGKTYRPSMFVTLTLPSYGKVGSTGAPLHPASYDYRRAALDALHFPKLVDRFWQNLRRCAGYRVQYFATVEPQRRLALHLHTALRGAVPRRVIKDVIKATYVQVWWPSFDQPVFVDELPVWDGGDYCDPATGEILPTWDEAVDQLGADPAARPAHVARFGKQTDIAGIVAPSAEADRTIRYLTKYLTKSISDAHTDDVTTDPGYLRHVDRLHAELRYLPCSEACANWLRYGVQPLGAGPGLRPGQCEKPAHDRANLGHGGRRVLVSRQWSGKTLAQTKADRAAVVRETLLAAGIVAPEVERMAATVQLPDGSPRFVWTDYRPDPSMYARVILASIAERQRWRAQYEAAKTLVDNSFGNVPVPP